MSKYFDKDFFKFAVGFLAIVSVSLIFIIATRHYEEVKAQTATVFEAIINVDKNNLK